MSSLALLLLLAGSRLNLVDEVYQIPAEDWRFVQLGLNQQSARVFAHYRVEEGSPQVDLSLLRREDLELMTRGERHGTQESTRQGGKGDLSYQVRDLGEYCFVIANHGKTPARVHLRVWLEFSGVTQLSPARQRNVILVSFAVFFAIVSFSAHRLLRYVRRS
jgi:hypothetical protein